MGRKTAKVVTLSLANSITSTGLARRLGYSDDPTGRAMAKQLMEDFWRGYPQVAAFTELMRWQVALTGMTETWAGRHKGLHSSPLDGDPAVRRDLDLIQGT